MNLIVEQIVSIVAIGLGILILLVVELTFKINKKKALAGLVLSIIYLVFAGYYAYLAFSMERPGFLSKPEVIQIFPPGADVSKQDEKTVGEKAETTEKAEALSVVLESVVLEIDSHRVVAGPDDEIEMSKKANFKIKSVKTNPTLEKVKANFVGFVGNPKYNDGQDIGYLILYGKIRKKLAVDKSKRKYKIDIVWEKENLGTIYIKYVD